MNKREIGSEYEAASILFLEQQKVQILEKNFRCKIGEIDIIGLYDNKLIFFEVKYRSTKRYGVAAEAINSNKMKTISMVADYYRVTHRQYSDRQISFDVIAIDNDKEIKWIKNAFQYCGKGF